MPTSIQIEGSLSLESTAPFRDITTPWEHKQTRTNMKNDQNLSERLFNLKERIIEDLQNIEYEGTKFII